MKMNPEDIQFVREQDHKIRHCPNPVDCESCPDRGRLLNLLIESEAMREKAEWKMRHRDCQRTDSGTWYCVGPAVDSRHDLTDADWIAAKRKEILG